MPLSCPSSSDYTDSKLKTGLRSTYVEADDLVLSEHEITAF